MVNNAHFPADELKAWIETRYVDSDEYSRQLKKAHLAAVEKQSIAGLEKLANILFISKSLLYYACRSEHDRLTAVYGQLIAWLKEAGDHPPTVSFNDKG